MKHYLKNAKSERKEKLKELLFRVIFIEGVRVKRTILPYFKAKIERECTGKKQEKTLKVKFKRKIKIQRKT